MSTMPDPSETPTVAQVKPLVAKFMGDAWVAEGYTAPNTDVYPWLWLWDSCFHVLVWAALGRPDRALSELAAVLDYQDETGFVPHMGYQLDPQHAVGLWGRANSSSITQPPMYAHALRWLVDHGVEVPDELIERSAAGLRFLFEVRARDHDSGLITVVHPWETGCDDSPRWDHFCPGDGFDLTRWRQHKIDLLADIRFGSAGSPIANPSFAAAPIGFNALVAWNARELAAITGDQHLIALSDELSARIAQRWDRRRRTWIDGGPSATTSGSVRTADALCALLVVDDPQSQHAAFADLDREGDYGGSFGPRGVHPNEPMYDPSTYWRGPVWPQLAYLLWWAARTSGAPDMAERLRQRTVTGAVASGFAEYWNGDTGHGGGAIPQSWAGLALIMAEA